jgi:hypothetical protein
MQIFGTGIAQLPVSDSPNSSALVPGAKDAPNAAQKVYPEGAVRLLWVRGRAGKLN